jgi:hypothetical protein
MTSETKKARRKTKPAGEIAPIPAIVNTQRRQKACKDFKFFCKEYFPNTFKLEWSDDRLRLIEQIEKTAEKGCGKIALSMHRASGKTTLFLTAALWAVLYGYAKHVIIVNSDAKFAKLQIDYLKYLINSSGTLLKDFPEAIYPFWKLCNSAALARWQLFNGNSTKIEWKSDGIKFAQINGSMSSGATISSATCKQNISVLPNMIILDDSEAGIE